ncbi:Anaerobic dehydrogenases, typically selenocysteine-containing [hydrothermal vent metagenome]|uniref:Anaerobic dehydrogenases, typically selenocysteine-containing n=1 Tax=hydrothermal vent metagenome TaxID=652676 RepID=A0A1W1BML8_9ZZZZ
MKIIEVSRRKFLKGSVALSVYAASSLHANIPVPKCITQASNKIPNSLKEIPFLCNMCRNKCAGIARVEEHIVTKIDPNPFFPKSRDMICPKGNAGIQALYDKDRLKYPLIKIGKRGDGNYKRVTWDEAYAYINDKLVNILDKQKDNRSTIAYCNGEGFNKDEYIQFFGEKIGSANFLDEGSICLNTKLGATLLTIGDVGEMDVAGSDYLILLGANRFESLITPDSVDMARLQKKQKLVVVDPRATVTALKANEYLPINVGTDLALILSMTYIAIKENLYNAEFVKKQFKDFDKYQEHILKQRYTSAWAESKTAIPKEKIEKLTKEFFDAKRPLLYMGRRSVWAKNDFQLRRAMVLLNALAGSINRKGGIIFGEPIKLPQEEINSPIYDNAKGRFDLDGVVYGSQKGGSWLNFREKVITKTAPYEVKAMFIRKHNLMHNMPNIAKTKKMLEMMDLVVVLDTMPTDTALMADVILPECTYLEREDKVVSFNRLEPSLALRNQVIEPLYESRSMQDILKGLGKKLSKPLFEISKKYDEELQESIKSLGEKKAFNEGGYDLIELYKKDITQRNQALIEKKFGKDVYQILKDRGVWYPNIDKYHKEIFNGVYEYYPEDKRFYSVDRKFTVKCYLKKLQKNGFDPMPTWRDAYDFKVAKDSFRMITGRYVMFTQSATTNNIMLRDLEQTNHVWINNQVAKSKKIALGDLVEVSSSIGKVKIKAYPTNKIHPQVVWFAHGYNSTSQSMTNSYGNGANDNEIIEDKFEKIYGCATMHHTDVKIRKL